MYKLLILVLVMLCCGCGGVRSQHASNATEGTKAVEIDLAQAKAMVLDIVRRMQVAEGSPEAVAFAFVAKLIDDSRTINKTVADSIPAVAGVPAGAFPKPAKTAKEIAADPTSYRPPPAPSPFGWKTIAVGIVGALGLIGRFGPAIQEAAPFLALIPGAGPIISGLTSIVGLFAKVNWATFAHGDLKETDKALEVATPILVELGKLSPSVLPERIQQILTPDRINAIRHIVATQSPPIITTGDA